MSTLLGTGRLGPGRWASCVSGSAYGAETAALLEQVDDRPELAEPVEGAETYLRVEVLWAVTHEGGLHLDDVRTRRTRISIETWDRGLAAGEPVARLMAGPLGWDEAAIAREVERYGARVAADRRSQEQQSDEGAELERLTAPDPRLGAARWRGTLRIRRFRGEDR